MPRVPIVEGNSVARRGRPVEAVRPVAVDDTVGRALSSFGRTLHGVVESNDRIAAEIDDTTSRKLTLEYQQRAAGIISEYKGLEGLNAVAARPEYEKRIEELRGELVGRTSNDRMRAMTEDRLAGYATAHLITIGERHDEQLKVETDRTELAQIDSNINSAAETWRDPAVSGQFVATVEAVAFQRAGRLGISEDARDAYVEEQVSAAHRSVFNAMMAEDEIDAAMAYVDENAGALSYEDETAARAALREPLRFRQAQGDADLVMNLSVPAVDGNEADDEDPASQVAGAASLDPASFFNDFTVQWEGEEAVVDSNGAVAKYGINAAYNPGVDVNNLSRDGAYQVFRDRYFVRSGADKLPPDLAAAHVDTFYLNEKEAGRILRESGGDVQKYLDLRQQFLDGLVERNPEKFERYQRGWTNRTNALRKYVGAGPSRMVAGQGVPRTADGAMDATALYTRLDQVAEAQGWTPERAERARAELATRISRDDTARNRQEEASWDSALGQAVDLGDNFTDVGQIRGYSSLPPARRKTLKDMAEANARGTEIASNGEVHTALKVASIMEPEAFAATDLREYKHLVSPSEYEQLQVDQARIAAKPQEEKNLRASISGTISFYNTGDLGIDDQADIARVAGIMDERLRRIEAVREGKRSPNDEEMRDAFRFATRQQEGRPREHERQVYQIPLDARRDVIAALRASGKTGPITHGDIIETYEANPELYGDN